MQKEKYIFTYYEHASESPEWKSIEKYDQQECCIVHRPEFTGENYLIEFSDGVTIGVEEYEIEKLK